MEIIKPKNVKSGEVDGILAEMLKTDIETKAKYFEKLFKNIWSEKTPPKLDCEDAKDR